MTTFVHDPGNKLRIDQIWAFVSVDEKGDEGLCAFQSSMGWTPLIAADEARLESLRPVAQRIADASGKPIRLLKFSTREIVEEIQS